KILNYGNNKLNTMHIMDILHAVNSSDKGIDWTETPLYKVCMCGKTYNDTLAVFWSERRELIPIELTATPIKDENTFVGIVVAFQDITERKRTEEKLAHLAQYDALTGLLNRNAFIKQAEQSISRARRNRQSIALLFLDLDRFKQVNDNLGHEVGDYILTESASRLKKCTRNGDILSRLGGDEFTVILESVMSNRTAAIVAEKIIKTLSQPFVVNNNEIFIGASIGIAKFPESAYDAEALLRCADIAMYKVKKKERNSYRFFTYEMQKEVMQELELENQLRCAMDKNQFQLHYQVKCCPYINKIVGIEALLRWFRSDDESIKPDLFIPKAEEMGLILPIGRWVLETVAKQISEWLKLGLIDEEFSISVNLSMKQLMDDNLLDEIKEILSSTEIPATCLELEVTESIMMEEPVATIDILNQLHQLGIRLSIDDFGTGYSSLNYLRQMPLDTLKIDRSFIQDIGISQQNETIIKAITALSHNLELKVVAEGVEIERQLKFLKQHECDYIQGYYFGRPVPADEMTKVLKEQANS
ncbi:MAG: EAL domain-containing protein, partial [Kangiellaceae bacterium]|nr:EAL domain-containing protein [Kangiellaceae bacterium]